MGRGAFGRAGFGRAVIVGALTLVLALVGCSGGTGPHLPEGASAEDAAEAALLPLSFLLGYDQGRAISPYYLHAQSVLQENAVMACMKEHGFWYAPAVPELADLTRTANEERTSELIAASGYGIASGQAGTGGFLLLLPAMSDEQLAYLDGLDDAEAEEWQRALHGEPVVGAGGGFDTEGGCALEGFLARERYQQRLLEDPDWQAAEEFLAAIPSDGALAEINASWSACMAEAGYDFAIPSDAENSIQMLVHKTMVDGTPRDEVRTNDLLEQEIPLAQADYACRESTGWTTESLRIRSALEHDYVDQHGPALEAALENAAR